MLTPLSLLHDLVLSVAVTRGCACIHVSGFAITAAAAVIDGILPPASPSPSPGATCYFHLLHQHACLTDTSLPVYRLYDDEYTSDLQPGPSQGHFSINKGRPSYMHRQGTMHTPRPDFLPTTGASGGGLAAFLPLPRARELPSALPPWLFRPRLARTPAVSSLGVTLRPRLLLDTGVAAVLTPKSSQAQSSKLWPGQPSICMSNSNSIADCIYCEHAELLAWRFSAEGFTSLRFD